MMTRQRGLRCHFSRIDSMWQTRSLCPRETRGNRIWTWDGARRRGRDLHAAANNENTRRPRRLLPASPSAIRAGPESISGESDGTASKKNLQHAGGSRSKVLRTGTAQGAFVGESGGPDSTRLPYVRAQQLEVLGVREDNRTGAAVQAAQVWRYNLRRCRAGRKTKPPPNRDASSWEFNRSATIGRSKPASRERGASKGSGFLTQRSFTAALSFIGRGAPSKAAGRSDRYLRPDAEDPRGTISRFQLASEVVIKTRSHCAARSTRWPDPIICRYSSTCPGSSGPSGSRWINEGAAEFAGARHKKYYEYQQWSRRLVQIKNRASQRRGHPEFAGVRSYRCAGLNWR